MYDVSLKQLITNIRREPNRCFFIYCTVTLRNVRYILLFYKLLGVQLYLNFFARFHF